MPHQCTNCSHTFEDGSKQMLGGCPECGGNKFQFLPGGAVADSRDGNASPAESESGPSTARAPTPSKPKPTAASPESTAFDASGNDADIIEAPAEPLPDSADAEDAAQASARRAVVSKDELPPVEANADADVHPVPDEEPERPSLTALRKELNEQFESIKILQPGEYELNLMELYDREEYIIALEEDGRYVIEVPDSWRRNE